MSRDIDRALARTALLLERDVFVGADHRRIVEGLRGTTTRILASRSNVDSMAGQTALVTLYAQLVMMGLQIDLDIPTVGLVCEQPPLRGDDLIDALVDYSDDLLPGGSSRPAPVPDITFALGDTPAPSNAVRVSGTAWQANVGLAAEAYAWRGAVPIGAIAAGAAAAADGLRVALPRIAERLGRPTPDERRFVFDPGRRVALDLSDYAAPSPLALGDVDMISGGAIINAALYTLRRIAAVKGRVRVLEPESLDLPNLNRYSVARRHQVGILKISILEDLSTADLRISGLPVQFNESTLPSTGPLAARVLVGVDNIPSRWLIHGAAVNSWVCVGATSHFYVLDSVHPAGRPCAGCVHPRDDGDRGDIPTISFVSFWAGFMQALELIREAAGRPRTMTTSTNVWPLGLEGRLGIHALMQLPVATCPVKCRASSMLRRQSVVA